MEIEACRDDMPGRWGTMAGVVAEVGVLTSRIPPPDVTSGFGSGFLPQNDHLLFDASAAVSLLGTMAGASGSPRRDLDSHGAVCVVDVPEVSRRARRAADVVLSRMEVLGVGLGRPTVVW